MSTLTLNDRTDAFQLKRALPALLALALAAALALLGLRQGDKAAPHADVTRLPAQIGTWQMTASEATDPKTWALSPSDRAALSLDSYTQRAYRDSRTGREVYLLLEYRTLGRGAFNHRPEACYPASGFVLTGRHDVPIFYDGRRASALTVTADYAGSEGKSHQVLLYWFATGRRTEASFWNQQVQMALGRLQPDTNGWAFVRLVCETPPGQEAAALAAEQDFARQASPSLVAAIAPVPTGASR